VFFKEGFAIMIRKKPSGACYDRAVNIIAAAEHSTQNLRRKLITRGYTEEETAETLSRLAAENLLDDKRFAEMWIDFRLRRKDEGGRRLFTGLLARGIDRETAEAAVKAAALADEYRACLIRAREKAEAAAGGDDAAVTGLLLKKGFSLREIRSRGEEE
jgi:regulatory protein